jgi:hypothetical protein
MEITRTVTIRATSEEGDHVMFTVPIEITVRLHPESRPMVAKEMAGVETSGVEGTGIASAIALARRNRDLTPDETAELPDDCRGSLSLNYDARSRLSTSSELTPTRAQTHPSVAKRFAWFVRPSVALP